MTSTHAGDAFFDSDNEDQGPNLTGEYNRGNTPPSSSQDNLIKPTGNPSAGSSTSGHFSSDSTMSKTKETMSRDGYNSRSRSRTPSGSTYRYSDSFDSEQSDDSRHSSPSRSRRGRGGGKKKSGGDTGRRFDSGTSRDSRTTFRSTNSSVYGKTNKKSTNKSPPKKAKGRGLASSTQNTPRGGNVNETTRRMLSAKGHTISRLRNEYEVLKTTHEELEREFKLQKQVHRKNERVLDKYTKQEVGLPMVMKAQNSELEHYRKKCQTYRDKERQKDHQLKQYNEKLNRTEDELKTARSILENKGLKERADLQKERDALERNLEEKERKLEEVEKYVKNMKKNQRHERRDWKNNEREFKGQIEQLEMENERLQLQLREKEKELEIKNIYSNRIVKPPGRLLAQSHSPNSLRPMMVPKSTTTDDIQLNKSPRQPQAPESSRRAKSEDAIDSRIKSPRDERLKQKAEEQRQKSRERTEEKKELSESDRILMELDAGTMKPEEKKQPPSEEDDETARILRQFDDNNFVKSNSQRQQAEENRRKEEERKRQMRMEEEERRKKEEEERKRKEEEKKKPQWLKGSTTTTTTTSSSSASNSGYTPSAFNNSGSVRPGLGPSRASQSNQQQHKAATSKLRWLSSDSSVHKPEQERKEMEEQDAKLTNGATDSPRRSPKLNPSDEDEEDYPFFGAKPAPAKPAKQKFAVNSVKDLQKMSAAREGTPPGKIDDDYDGMFAKPAVKDDTKSKKERQEQEANEAEERRKKDALLAKMREIDDDGEKPGSGRSQKSYKHTDPVKNMHKGLPSHPDVSQKNRRKSSDSEELSFGGYAPTFSSSTAKPAAKGPAKKKNPFFDNDPADNDSDSGFKLSPKHSPHRAAKKNNLMADLFGSGSEKSDNPSRSSFGDDNVFSSSTKAKPVAETGSYPWEKKVGVGQGGANKPNGTFGQKSLAVSSFSDNFEDDLEELTL